MKKELLRIFGVSLVFCVCGNAFGESFSVRTCGTLVDALGERTCEEFDVHEIIGMTNYLEIIAYDAQGLKESMGYCDSAMPVWKTKPDNSTVVRVIGGNASGEMRGCSGCGASVAVKTVGGKLFLDVQGDTTPQVGRPVNVRPRLIDCPGDYAYWTRSSKMEGIDKDNQGVIRATLYFNDSWHICLWYELVDPAGRVVDKGCVCGEMKEDGIKNITSKVVVGTGAVTVDFCRARWFPKPSPTTKTRTLSLNIAFGKGNNLSSLTFFPTVR